MLLLILMALAVVGLAGVFALDRITAVLTHQFGTLLAERQVQYDRHRGMAVLNGELQLAGNFARAPGLLAWMADEDDADARARGLAEMEHYRRSFSDGSAFVVVNGSGNYYFNDAQNSYGADPLSYTLDPALESDAWYYATRERREGCYLNVDADRVLRVTKVWINCVVRRDGQVLGVVGTGLDLSGFIQDVVDVSEAGTESIFIDRTGAVQAHRDPSLVDFRSVTKDIADRTTIFSLLDTGADMAHLRAMMSAVAASPGTIRTATLGMGGVPRMVGVGYLDHIGWYNVTVMDLEAIIDRSVFLPLALVVAAIFIAVALALSWIFRIAVLGRLEKVEAGLAAVRAGKRANIEPDRSEDEIGRLSRTFIEMSDTIAEARFSLENQVRERTEQIESLINIDTLTGIDNRRGFAQRFALGRRRSTDAEAVDGLMLIDIDHFKQVNDTAGHAAGDQVVIAVAGRLRAALRQDDICARWGGDEFVVLVRNSGQAGLDQVANALCEMMRQRPVVLPDGKRIAITLSVGAVPVTAEDTLDVAIDMADAALYSAKEDGRDRVVTVERGAGNEADSADVRSA